MLGAQGPSGKTAQAFTIDPDQVSEIPKKGGEIQMPYWFANLWDFSPLVHK